LGTCTYTLSTFIPLYLVLVLKYFAVVLMASLDGAAYSARCLRLCAALVAQQCLDANCPQVGLVEKEPTFKLIHELYRLENDAESSLKASPDI